MDVKDAIEVSSIAVSSMTGGDGLERKSETGFDLAGKYLISLVH